MKMSSITWLYNLVFNIKLMRNSFILWDSEKSKNFQTAVASKEYEILYDYIDPTSLEYTKVNRLLQLYKKEISSSSKIVAEIPWASIN